MCGSVNVYQPYHILLASSLLQQGHTLMLMACGEAGAKELSDRQSLLSRAHYSFKQGLDVVHDCSQYSPCITAELLLSNGK